MLCDASPPAAAAAAADSGTSTSTSGPEAAFGAGPATDATSAQQQDAGGRRRRVSFASGPLDPGAHPHSTDDGHPAREGAVAVAVRRSAHAPSWGLDLTRGNVLMLEQLLGPDCAQSVTRLKRRVGLLPPIRAPRPHIGCTTSSYVCDAPADAPAAPAAAAAARLKSPAKSRPAGRSAA